MAEEEKIIFKVREAAEYLQVSLVTLRKIESKGDLIPFRTPGRHRRYSLRMLNEFLEASRKPARWQESGSESQ
jgi:excisionase family DNA binding protein